MLTLAATELLRSAKLQFLSLPIRPSHTSSFLAGSGTIDSARISGHCDLTLWLEKGCDFITHQRLAQDVVPMLFPVVMHTVLPKKEMEQLHAAMPPGITNIPMVIMATSYTVSGLVLPRVCMFSPVQHQPSCRASAYA